MPPAARTGDPTDHGGVITLPPPGFPAVETVLIGGRPAAVVGSLHVCPVHELELGPLDVVLPALSAATGVVLIGGVPAARMGDQTACGAEILAGAMNVLIGGVL
ncbi:PAAR domain-containing protein [Streptantibioticus silvisoli]|uniref:PAAR domain-containing protein n=1 Tax=Streptantibioticus silvisoli TaxID=2705255 RepID=A0ABT6VRR7_9ACTN|nr:PAAR domain-containing protein [Streptantibioticus silvisoli]MDI5961169.1 PAAR domain-containing protein [Streptantibioticus silvisoli]